jgi:hypothetical protein
MKMIRGRQRSSMVRHDQLKSWQTGCAVALGLLAFASSQASAATLTVTCERADVIVSTWNGPMTITYTGDAEGTIQLKAPYGELAMPAKLVTHPMADGTPGRVVKAFGDTTMTMPDLAALETCIAKQIEPGQDADSGSYDMARDACLAQTPPTASPIPMTAQIDLGIFPGESPSKYGLVIEIKRTYLEKTKAPNGRTHIDSFPAKCDLVEK